MSDLCIPNDRVRPAIASEKWQIQQLLTNFAWESPRRSRRSYYWVLGFLLAIVISLSFLIGLMFLLGVSCGIAFSIVKIIFLKNGRNSGLLSKKGVL